MELTQSPEPGAQLRAFRGDVLTLVLEVSPPGSGAAFVRTNLGRAATGRAEVVAEVEERRPALGRDWHDVPMETVGRGRFRARLPLAETGVFEAKAFFLPAGRRDPLWPSGPNVRIKVAPPHTVAVNSLYTAFVRMFRPPGAGGPGAGRCEGLLDGLGYTVIPPSGTFRQLVRQLDHVLGALRCRVVQLLPIHPVPTTYARMGRFGSPYAGLDFFDVDPALAEFDRKTTPLDQFRELVDAVHARGGRLFLDIPINHTGWASWLQIHRPHWFARDEGRRFASPGAWGVTWEDLSKLDYRHRDLWRYMARVFLYWCRQGVDGFRCDAGYMVPVEVWRYLVARVRQEYSDTVFLLEGLGGPLASTEALLSEAGLDWAYSELFQNYDRAQIEAYLPGADALSASRGLLVHYAETHDNNRLAATSETFARLRTALTALLCREGGFGLTCGAEWLAVEKLDVHGAADLSWGAESNLIGWIARLHAVHETHPSFLPGVRIRLVHRGPGNVLAARRDAAQGGHPLLIVANLDPTAPARAAWDPTATPPGPCLWDLLTGDRVEPEPSSHGPSVALAPGQVRCLSPGPSAVEAVERALAAPPREPEAVRRQRLRAKVIELARWYGREEEARDRLDELAEALDRDPADACGRIAGREWPPVTRWTWPEDTRRRVPVAAGNVLLITAPHPFRADLRVGDRTVAREDSLPRGEGRFWAVVVSGIRPAQEQPAGLAVRVHVPGGTRATEAPILLLGAEEPRVCLAYDAREIGRSRPYALLANARGAMAQVRAGWGEIESLYDAWLAGNLDPNVPVDRHVMLARMRGWVVVRGYSQALGRACTERFALTPEGSAAWRFSVPCGMGRRVVLEIVLRLSPDENAVHLEVHRPPAGEDREALPDEEPVRLVLRPDVEDRPNHGHTKAFAGPESAWPAAVRPLPAGFEFAPHSERTLRVTALSGTFVAEPEWLYGVDHPWEASRGIDPLSDLFSPGYLRVRLAGGERAVVRAEILTGREFPAIHPPPGIRRPPGPQVPLGTVLRAGLNPFLVHREGGLTVIAGYPWFLDWGRDALIFARGMLAAGLAEEALEILLGFARFEDRGTLPNVIRGADASNRDTSDAPLWLAVAAGEAAGVLGPTIWARRCGVRTLAEVVRSIGSHYLEGTPNGVGVDPATGLVFSPAHFTWMDTNHPAGTPRQGYPVEIQALWYGTLGALEALDDAPRWHQTRARLTASFADLFFRENEGFLSDCLHGPPGRGAREAEPDDHLRPNQLLALTMGLFTDTSRCRRVLEQCQVLLVPGGIRSLADRPVRHPLRVEHQGRPVLDPQRPYRGRYEGPEDPERKAAYHNGTAWTWPFPLYAEALWRVFGGGVAAEARSLLYSVRGLLEAGCAGLVPEILDGDAPHAQRGCGAQAWGVSELVRVLALLEGRDKVEPR